MRLQAAIVAMLMSASAPAQSQTIYKCSTPKGAVTYQETPCPAEGARRRVDTSHGASADPVAREMLEGEAIRGDPLARGFVEEARERERHEREERQGRESAMQSRAADEPSDWAPPWGWAGRPGQARPKIKPSH